MLAAVMVPLSCLLFFAIIRACQIIYELAVSMLSWPLL
jgi:hypothetical protein